MRDVWYSGLRAIATREMNDEDLASIRRFRRGRKRDESIALLIPAALLVLGFALAFHYRDAGALGAAAATVALSAARPWGVSDAMRRQFRSLQQDETRREVVICKGRVSEVFFAYDEERKLQPRSLLHRPPKDAIVVEILAESGAIMTINGVRATHLSETRMSTTAPRSAHAEAAANFLRTQVEGIAVGERALSVEECAELASHAPALSRLDIALATVVAILAITTWWYSVAKRSPTLLVPIATTAVAVWLLHETFTRWRIHRRFAGDISYARVIIVRAEEDGVPVGPANEHLAVSGIIWTLNDEPARWRRAPAVRRLYIRRI